MHEPSPVRAAGSPSGTASSRSNANHSFLTALPPQSSRQISRQVFPLQSLAHPLVDIMEGKQKRLECDEFTDWPHRKKFEIGEQIAAESKAPRKVKAEPFKCLQAYSR